MLASAQWLKLLAACATFVASPIYAATIRVPEDRPTIQAAIDAAQAGDTVVVRAGRYVERIQLRPSITLRSAGDETAGEGGLKRALATIIDGGGKSGSQAGVTMAERSTLDGFTITAVGEYDERLWKKHFDSHGEELGDDEGSVQAEGTVPAVSVPSVYCLVTNNIVHHNGDVGIAVVGREDRQIAAQVIGNRAFRNLGGGIGVADFAEPVVQRNTCYENLRAGIGCRNSRPLILENECFQNIRAGIGCREGAQAVMRSNRCYQNRRAGIGVRMAGTAPVLERNECFENDMAGIGCRDGAEPIIRNNLCRRNKLAGIGCDGASPTIIGNECRENEMAGIGLRGKGNATLQKNQCVENKLVAIGITDGSTATILGNRLLRTGGMPPLIAVKESQAWIYDNEIHGGGIAAVLVHGTATITGNRFHGQGEKQGNAIWVQAQSTATIDGNDIRNYRSAVQATQAAVTIKNNSLHGVRGVAMVVKDSSQPAHVFGNVATSPDAQMKIVDLQGPAGIVRDNVVQPDKR